MNKTTRLFIRISPTLKDRAKTILSWRGRTLSEFIREKLEELVNTNKD